MVLDTTVGDVLILATDRVSHRYAVGLVTTDGQQSFVEPRQPLYANDRPTASAMAKAMVVPGRRIFIQEFADSVLRAVN